jgi:hypothetical protein
MKNAALLLLSLLLSLSAFGYDSEKVLLQQTLFPDEETAIDVIFQRGSQIFIKMDRIAPDYPDGYPPPGYIGNRTKFFGNSVLLSLPSFMALLTSETPTTGDTVLFQDGNWIAEYSIDPQDPYVLSYDMKGPINVTNYPWIESAEAGMFYVTPIASISNQEGGEELSIYSRWMYSENLGWFYNIQQFYSLPLGTFLWPLNFELPKNLGELLP